MRRTEKKERVFMVLSSWREMGVGSAAADAAKGGVRRAAMGRFMINFPERVSGLCYSLFPLARGVPAVEK
jgi:hypothetical protein